MENCISNNSMQIGGRIIEEPVFSHEIFDEKFYKFVIETKRLSQYTDNLPVIVSERLVNIKTLTNGKIVKVSGQFRSYNQFEGVGEKSRLVLSIFAKQIEEIDDEGILTLNEATFVGFICKSPIYRETPLGREIADVLIAVNRAYKKSDYIPCILWGRNARFCGSLDVGTMVKLSGRVQSRNYEKKLSDGTVSKKTAYEVSISKFSVVENFELNKKDEVISDSKIDILNQV